MVRSYKTFFGLGAIFCTAFIAVIIFAFIINSKGEEKTSLDTISPESTEMDVLPQVSPEEKKKETERILNDIVEVSIGEFKEKENEHGSFEGIPVKIRNKSNEDTPLGVQISAINNVGSVIDVASVYTDVIHPNETQEFLLFTNPTLPIEDLKTAKYEIYNLYIEDRTEIDNNEPAGFYEESVVPEKPTKESRYDTVVENYDEEYINDETNEANKNTKGGEENEEHGGKNEE